VTGVQRADELIVVHHDDTVSRFTDVSYTLGCGGLRVITADGAETTFPRHDVLTTHVLLAHWRRRPSRDEVVLAA
jgi:hypothetical protein